MHVKRVRFWGQVVSCYCWAGKLWSRLVTGRIEWGSKTVTVYAVCKQTNTNGWMLVNLSATDCYIVHCNASCYRVDK